MGDIRVTVEDLETGERDEQVVVDGDYMIVTTGECYLDKVQRWASSGTVQLTVRGHHPRPGPLPAEVRS